MVPNFIFYDSFAFNLCSNEIRLLTFWKWPMLPYHLPLIMLCFLPSLSFSLCCQIKIIVILQSPLQIDIFSDVFCSCLFMPFLNTKIIILNRYFYRQHRERWINTIKLTLAILKLRRNNFWVPHRKILNLKKIKKNTVSEITIQTQNIWPTRRSYVRYNQELAGFLPTSFLY